MRLAQLLDPWPAPPSPVVMPAHVGGLAAWQDLLRRGALTLLRDAFLGAADAVAVPVGTRVTPAHRALAVIASFLGSRPSGGVLPALPPRAVVAGASAAWVYTGLCDGAAARCLTAGTVVLELAHDAGARRPDVPAGVLLRCSPGLTRDTIGIGGVAVTSPARTAADVACRLPFEHAVPVLRTLAAGSRDLTPVDLRLVERALETRGRVVGRPAARRALAAARADEVDPSVPWPGRVR
ncbi:hypothetical protein [Myceligenerans indicum]|uniref:AbiEi antitoxin C-terminal domain-containing protein n=1 Tax=Myceligenerans indicum TaxID=2593663 RepID=A0ABS1LHZ0_9MICO|nr:hypothetical protein [Myceligenerans indicum]MBL0885748.1 hypothetical protein [Myceligenerans indicum]